MPVKIRPRSGEYYIIRRRIVRRGRFLVSFLSFPPCPSPRRSRSSTFGPCGCLHKMPRLFPGMQSSTGGASVLGSNILSYKMSGEGFRIGKVISRAYFSISGCVKFALVVRVRLSQSFIEKFALLSTIFSLPPLVQTQRQLRLKRRRETVASFRRLLRRCLWPHCLKGDFCPLHFLPSELKGCETNELCFCERRSAMSGAFVRHRDSPPPRRRRTSYASQSILSGTQNTSAIRFFRRRGERGLKRGTFVFGNRGCWEFLLRCGPVSLYSK